MRFAALTLLLSVLPTHAADARRIVFVAGLKDHGVPGRHEYEQDLVALKTCLDNSNVKNITTQLYTGTVPAVADIKNAAALVMESSGDRTPTEHHVLFPQDATTDHQTYNPETNKRLEQIDGLAKKGLGVV